MNFPCELCCPEECDICKSEYDIKKGEERIMNKIKVPNEGVDKIQAILNCETMLVVDKAKAIYRYEKMICDMAPRNRKETPKMSAEQIEKILIERNL